MKEPMTDEQLELCETHTPSRLVVKMLTNHIRKLREVVATSAKIDVECAKRLHYTVGHLLVTRKLLSDLHEALLDLNQPNRGPDDV